MLNFAIKITIEMIVYHTCTACICVIVLDTKVDANMHICYAIMEVIEHLQGGNVIIYIYIYILERSSQVCTSCIRGEL